jgi:hypothetical protein
MVPAHANQMMPMNYSQFMQMQSFHPAFHPNTQYTSQIPQGFQQPIPSQMPPMFGQNQVPHLNSEPFLARTLAVNTPD